MSRPLRTFSALTQQEREMRFWRVLLMACIMVIVASSLSNLEILPAACA